MYTIKTRSIFLLFVCLHLMTSAICQTNLKVPSLKNELVKYKIFRSSAKLVDTDAIEVSKLIVMVVQTKKDQKELLKLKKEDWIKLLKDESSDWAANLCLYDMYKKEATTIDAAKKKEVWRICCKNEDIAYWLDTLK